MDKLYNYYGLSINRLCLAVQSSNEGLVDKLLADETFTEINEGVSPLYFITNDGDSEKTLRIFRKILNNERFTNVNSVIYDGNYSNTLLYYLLYKNNPVIETCCVELINSPKYQLIDYPGNHGDNSTDLNTALIREKKQAARAIMNHPDFTKIDFSFGEYDFVKKCKELYRTPGIEDKGIYEPLSLIMKEYVQRGYHDFYDATDTDIAKRLTDAIETLRPYASTDFSFSPIDAASNSYRKNNDLILEIINHQKFTGKMLLGHIKDIALDITDEEAYKTFSHNKKIEGWTPETYGELAYFLINHKRIGLLEAIIENDNICLSEQFFSYYKYFLKNAVIASAKDTSILDIYGYSKENSDKVFRIIEEKLAKQIANDKIDPSKLIELKEEDYIVLNSGMSHYFGLVHKNDAFSKKINDDDSLRAKLIYDEAEKEIGPFFNIFDRDKVWKYFSEYQSFEEYREMASKNKTKVYTPNDNN